MRHIENMLTMPASKASATEGRRFDDLERFQDRLRNSEQHAQTQEAS